MHLVTVITPHGFGHAAQVAPVLNDLQTRHADLQVTVVSTVPETFLRARINGSFNYMQHAADFGMHMRSALAINHEASANAYLHLHQDWERSIAGEADVLSSMQPDLVLADVPYQTLAAAAILEVPAVAMCSLNWADIYRYYFSGRPEAVDILMQMQAAYNSANLFLCPEPSMPMAWLTNRQATGTIAGKGHNRRQELDALLGVSASERLVLVAPGGVDTRFSMESWPRNSGVSWLVPSNWPTNHPDIYSFKDTGMLFTDVLASVDVVLGKCGYGTVAECVTNGTPLLYVSRPDWPEEATLVAWLEQHQACLPVDGERLLSGDMHELVEACCEFSVEIVDPAGAAEVAEHISSMLGK